MAIPFLTNVDLTFNQLLNSKLQILASDPGSPAEGQFWYNSTTKKFKYRTDTTTIDLTDALTLGGQNSAYHLARANHSGTQLASTVSDFDTQVRTSTLNQMTAPTADLSINSRKLTSVTDPSSPQDAATKNYVDGLVGGGVSWKVSVRAATTAAGTLASSFENGDVIDDITLATGDRILIKDQAAGLENGLYIVAASGAPTRASDANTAGEVRQAAAWVEQGTANADTAWVCTTDAPITLETTALAFVQFSGLGQVTAGAGLTKTGNTLDVIGTARITVNANDVDLASGVATPGTYKSVTVDTYGRTTAGTNPTTLSGYGITDAVKKYSATIGDAAATSFTITQATHGLSANQQLMVFVTEAAAGNQVMPDITIASGGDVTIAFALAPASDFYRVTIVG